MSKKKYQEKLKQSNTITHRVLMNQEGVKQQLRIIPELKEFIPPLSEHEYADLTASLLQEGCREALIVWNRGVDDYVLVDGHNRLQICRKNQLNYRIQLREFSSIEEVKDFMIINQLARRNLTKFQSSYFRGLRYLREKADWGGAGRIHQDQTSGKKTAQRIAEELQVGQATILRDAKVAKAIQLIQDKNPEVANDILLGKSTLNNRDLQLLANQPSDDLPKIRTTKDIKKYLRGSAEKSSLKKKKAEAISVEAAKDRLLEYCEVVREGKPVTVTLAHQIYQAAKELKNAVS